MRDVGHSALLLSVFFLFHFLFAFGHPLFPRLDCHIKRFGFPVMVGRKGLCFAFPVFIGPLGYPKRIGIAPFSTDVCLFVAANANDAALVSFGRILGQIVDTVFCKGLLYLVPELLCQSQCLDTSTRLFVGKEFCDFFSSAVKPYFPSATGNFAFFIFEIDTGNISVGLGSSFIVGRLVLGGHGIEQKWITG